MKGGQKWLPFFMQYNLIFFEVTYPIPIFVLNPKFFELKHIHKWGFQVIHKMDN